VIVVLLSRDSLNLIDLDALMQMEMGILILMKAGHLQMEQMLTLTIHLHMYSLNQNQLNPMKRISSLALLCSPSMA